MPTDSAVSSTTKSLVNLVAVLLIFASGIALSGCKNQEKERLRDTIVRTIEPHKLQQWAVPILAEHKGYYEIPRENWPSFLLTTNGPRSARIAEWTSGQRAVIVAWDSSSGERVLIVGDESLVLTEQYLGFQIEPWAAGVYFALDPAKVR